MKQAGMAREVKGLNIICEFILLASFGLFLLSGIILIVMFGRSTSGVVIVSLYSLATVISIICTVLVMLDALGEYSKWTVGDFVAVQCSLLAQVASLWLVWTNPVITVILIVVAVVCYFTHIFEFNDNVGKSPCGL